MSSTSDAGGSGRVPGGLATTLDVLRRAADGGADVLLHHVPDTGDHATGRVVDAFVDQAGDALRALAEGVAATLAARLTDARAPVVADEVTPAAPTGGRRAPGDQRGWSR